MSLLVSFTLGWSTNRALALMVGVFVGAVYGGSRSAILLNMPGAPAAVATAFDGYPLAKKGLAGEAMGLATVQSFIGTVAGVVALGVGAPLVAKLAQSVRSIDYLMLALMGLMMVGALGAKSMRRGLIAGAIGLFLGCIGIDPQTAVKRFTFDIVYLNGGVDFVVAMIGLFGASEALMQLQSGAKSEQAARRPGRIVPPWKETLRHLPLTIRAAITGILVGALPGAGGDIAALIAYAQAKRTVKNPKVPFGEGAVEGVIAPETANNAAIGGAFIPMLTLGIPGDAVTAVLISALMVHGVQPGPNFIKNSPDLFFLIIACLAVASVFLLLFGLTGIRLFTKVTEMKKGVLMPLILVLCVVGAFAVRNNVYDIFWMFGFGVFGYFLKKFDYPVAPVVLGIVLCPLIEENYRRGVLLEGSVWNMLTSIVESPVSVCLMLLLLFLLVSRSGMMAAFREKREKQKAGKA